MHPSAEVGLSSRAQISLMLSVPLPSAQLERSFPSSPLSLDNADLGADTRVGQVFLLLVGISYN